jgi:hypothetical protein
MALLSAHISKDRAVPAPVQNQTRLQKEPKQIKKKQFFL